MVHPAHKSASVALAAALILSPALALAPAQAATAAPSTGTAAAAGHVATVHAAKKQKKKTYKVKPTKSKNETLRIRKIMKKIEKNGGGKIIFTKGVYLFSNTVYLPSNVTVQLNKGAIIRKSKKAALKGKPSDSIFQTLRESRYKKTKIYGGYKGEKNITFKGSGTIDLAGIKGAHGILAAHTTNLKITGLKFTNSNQGHFIEINSSKNAKITKNSFTTAKDKSGEKEAINIDSADSVTGGLTVKWSKGDKTPVQDLVITDNTFTNVRVAIGTHKYSYDSKTKSFKYHLRIQIMRNKITGSTSDAIRAMAWKDSKISDNVITNPGGSGIMLAGTKNMTVANNVFKANAYLWDAILVRGKENNGPGGSYPYLVDQLSCANLGTMATNIAPNGGEVRLWDSLSSPVEDLELRTSASARAMSVTCEKGW